MLNKNKQICQNIIISDTMKYTFKAYRTTYKIITVEAEDESMAGEMAQQMLEEGEVRFDDEPWLTMKAGINPV